MLRCHSLPGADSRSSICWGWVGGWVSGEMHAQRAAGLWLLGINPKPCAPSRTHLLGGVGQGAPAPVLPCAHDRAQPDEDGVGLQPLAGRGNKGAERLALKVRCALVVKHGASDAHLDLRSAGGWVVELC